MQNQMETSKPVIVALVKWLDDDSGFGPDYLGSIKECQHSPAENAIEVTDMMHESGKFWYIPEKGRYDSNWENVKTKRGQPYTELGKKRLVNRWIRQDMARLADYYNDNWRMVGVSVTIAQVTIKTGNTHAWYSSPFASNTELGNDSLWGIESDCGEEYRSEIEREVLREALHNAAATVAKLESALTLPDADKMPIIHVYPSEGGPFYDELTTWIEAQDLVESLEDQSAAE